MHDFAARKPYSAYASYKILAGPSTLGADTRDAGGYRIFCSLSLSFYLSLSLFVSSFLFLLIFPDYSVYVPIPMGSPTPISSDTRRMGFAADVTRLGCSVWESITIGAYLAYSFFPIHCLSFFRFASISPHPPILCLSPDLFPVIPFFVLLYLSCDFSISGRTSPLSHLAELNTD